MDNSNTSAGPLSGCSTIPVLGYNKMTLNNRGEFLCPLAPCDQQYQPESQPPCPQWSVPSVSKDEALTALRKYVSEQGLHPKPAEEAVITDMETFHSYRYRLETFTETRLTKWTAKAYMGEIIDNAGQTPPQPWDISVGDPVYFRSELKNIPVPHTSFVKECGRCFGSGKIICTTCSMSGKVECDSCDGRGSESYFDTFLRLYQTRMCYMCSGSGNKMCNTCIGMGRYKCPLCLGHQKTTVSISLIVKWTNNQNEHSCKQYSGYVPHIKYLPGQMLFTDYGKRVHPLTHFPEATVVQASERLVKEHQEKYKEDARILQQRQTIELVSLTKVTYVWREESYVFYINGTDRGAFVDDYPTPRCDCCLLM